MISASDIVKLLEQIPIWKAISTLPKRVAELERQVAELQKASAQSKPQISGRECPICGSAMKVTKERPHPHFNFAGVKIHDMQCPDCGTAVQRTFEPGKGYS